MEVRNNNMALSIQSIKTELAKCLFTSPVFIATKILLTLIPRAIAAAISKAAETNVHL